MPPTSVYLVLPASMAWIAASLMLAGGAKSGSPAPRPMTLRPAAFSARALSVTAIVADGFTRSSAADRNGIIISLQAGANTSVSPPIHDSFCWDRRTLKRGTLHRKKLGTKGLNFSERFGDAGPAGAIFEKFCGEIPHNLARIAIRRSPSSGGLTDCDGQLVSADCSEVAREHTDLVMRKRRRAALDRAISRSGASSASVIQCVAMCRWNH